MADPTQLRVAALSPQALAKVREVEKQLGGAIVIAYEQPVVPAALTPEQVKVVEAAEQQLGVCLVAYEKPA